MPTLAALLVLTCLPALTPDDPPQGPVTLEQRLLREDPKALARAARTRGDARHGAVLFHQPQLACTKCHTTGEAVVRLGPDLARMGKDADGPYLVESLLKPSKVIKKGYETIVLVTDKGTTLTGLVALERPDAIVLRDASQEGKPVTVGRSAIESRTPSPVSLMPEGLVNNLADRQEFLDLVRYLLELAEGGPERAAALRPPPQSYASLQLPDYERLVDHAGLIASQGADSLRRGAAIYARVCANCHGTRDQPGSLPTSPRFARDRLKNGSDPFRMYQTLTHGFGMMTPQTWMVPEQKYDVIHYIRETYFRPHNPSQYVVVDPAYLKSLPRGTTRGPKPTEAEPWAEMDYGRSLMLTLQVGPGPNTACKGIAVRLDPGPGGVVRGRRWVVYDHDTMRLAAAWEGNGFIDWHGINFNGQHAVHPHLVGKVHVANPDAPGWANPDTATFDDLRLRGRDGRPYGPLPRSWVHYLGLFDRGDEVVLRYRVGQTLIHERPGFEPVPGSPVVAFTRTLDIGPTPRELFMRVAPSGTATAVVGPGELVERDGFVLLRVPAVVQARSVVIKVLISSGDPALLREHARSLAPEATLMRRSEGGPRRWTPTLRTQPLPGADTGPFAVDVLTLPEGNPWHCQMRLTGFDFLPGGKEAAVCTWDGDVWKVSGLDNLQEGLTWQRIASGLFQPLGLKVVNGKIYVGCRDQIVILHDLNGDGETDFYECFNSDHQVTEHFHEFAMGLQTDADGNFYYAKGARHALPALVPHHGTLLRVSKDGAHTDILATGFRAPNGVCLNPDGTFFLTDQEGHWIPKNRINRIEVGGYYGNFWGYHDVTDPSDRAMKQPVCWITNAFDRSPSELLWVTSDAWGPLRGSLLNFSYGYGKVYVIPHETVAGQVQGGMCELPIPPFSTGVMRGRFSPVDGQLYCCGMYAWAGNQTQPGGFYRVRYTGRPLHVPVGLHARATGMEIGFSAALDPKSANDAANYAIKTWSLKRSANYGSDHYDEKPSRVMAARLAPDGRSVFLEVEGWKPAMCMEIRYAVRSSNGHPVAGTIHNTIHTLPGRSRPPDGTWQGP